jgi:hypothetical protein
MGTFLLRLSHSPWTVDFSSDIISQNKSKVYQRDKYLQTAAGGKINFGEGIWFSDRQREVQ